MTETARAMKESNLEKLPEWVLTHLRDAGVPLDHVSSIEGDSKALRVEAVWHIPIREDVPRG